MKISSYDVSKGRKNILKGKGIMEGVNDSLFYFKSLNMEL